MEPFGSLLPEKKFVEQETFSEEFGKIQNLRKSLDRYLQQTLNREVFLPRPRPYGVTPNPNPPCPCCSMSSIACVPDTGTCYCLCQSAPWTLHPCSVSCVEGYFAAIPPFFCFFAPCCQSAIFLRRRSQAERPTVSITQSEIIRK